MVFVWENPTKVDDDWGHPYFRNLPHRPHVHFLGSMMACVSLVEGKMLNTWLAWFEGTPMDWKLPYTVAEIHGGGIHIILCHVCIFSLGLQKIFYHMDMKLQTNWNSHGCWETTIYFLWFGVPERFAFFADGPISNFAFPQRQDGSSWQTGILVSSVEPYIYIGSFLDQTTVWQTLTKQDCSLQFSIS